MKLFDAAARKTILGTLLLLLRELRRLATAVETLTDSFRVVHGHQPLFSTGSPQRDRQPLYDATTADADADAGRIVPHFEPDEPDWLKRDILEALCREQHIPVTEGMDLVQIGKAHGWLDASGQIIHLPAHYAD